MSPDANVTSYSLTQVTFTVSGTALATDIYNFRIVYDANNNGLYDAGDMIVTASNSLSKPTMTISINGQTGVSGTGRYLLIADVLSSAIAGRTITASIASPTDLVSSTMVNGTAICNKKIIAGTQPTDDFRSQATGNWGTAATWQSYNAGTGWITSSLAPTSSAKSITIQSGHTVNIAAAASADELTIQSGGVLSQRQGISFTIANGPSAFDFVVKNGGIYVINGTAPNFNASTQMEVQGGGTVRVDAQGTSPNNQSDVFASSNSYPVIFRSNSIYQWNTSTAFGFSGFTYFPNATGEIPIFRVSATQATKSPATAFVINGKYEHTGGISFGWAGTASKTFRNGFGGAGIITFFPGGGSNFITGKTAVIDGTVTINVNNSSAGLTNNLTLSSGANVTVSGSPTINIGGTTAGSATGTANLTISSGANWIMIGTPTLAIGNLTSSGIANLNIAGTFTSTSLNPVRMDYFGTNTLNITGTIGAGNTATFTANNAGLTNLANVIVNGSGSVGTLSFTSGFQTVKNFTLTSGSVTLGSNMTVHSSGTQTMTSGTLVLNGNTLTVNGDIANSGTGTITGSATSNFAIGGTGAMSGPFRFTPGSQTLNTLIINRTGVVAAAAAILGSNLTVNSITLSNGILTTGNNLLTWTQTGSLLPAAQTSYTANSTTYKNSYVCVCDATGAALNFSDPFDGSKGFRINNVGTNVWFPIGVDFKAPNRIWINNTGTTDNFTVAIKKADLNNNTSPALQRIWYVKEGTPGSTAADMRLYFTKQDATQFGISQDEVENGFDYTNTLLAQKDYGGNLLNISNYGTADQVDYSSNTLSTEVYAKYTIGVSKDVSGNTNGITAFNRFTVLNSLSNDLCTNATTVTVNGSSVSGELSGATYSSPFTSGNDVWYKFTPSCTGISAITISGFSGGSIGVQVWPISCPVISSGNVILSSGSSSGSSTFTGNYSLTSGVTYYIRVYVVTGFPSKFNISAANTVNVNNTGAPPPGNHLQGATNQSISGFTIVPGCTSSYTINSVKFTTSGTASSSDFVANSFKVYRDVNANNFYDNGTDILIAATGQSFGSTINFTLNGVPYTTNQTFFLVCDITTSATAGRTITASILSPADITSNVGVVGTAICNTQTIVCNATVPTISSNGSTNNICPSKTVILTSSHANSYLWNTGDTSKAITVNNTGNYFVTTTDAGGCKSTSDTTNVTYQSCSKPSGLGTSNVTNSSVKLSWSNDTCAVGYQYEYRKKGTITWAIGQTIGNSKTISGLSANTTYQWRVIKVCRINPDTLTSPNYSTGPEFTTLTFTAVSNNELINIQNATFKITPNPTTGNATLTLTNNKEKVTIKVTDASGKVVWQTNSADSNIIIPSSKFASGVYMVSVVSSSGVETVKLVRE